MSYLMHKNQSKIFVIYIIFAVILLNFFTTIEMSNIQYNINNLDLPQILAPQYPTEDLVFEQASRSKDYFSILNRVTNPSELGIVYNHYFILDNRYATYQYLHISKLFLFLERLLIPRQNTSKYKISLNIKYSV
ncbi:hypothetical protein [Alkaliphilus transvaalensis]|uniref:hypothetical protein n=1 Tax=Alkaliphilus transvaalensis TaxID=114628 RepID=UPI00047E9032|nr:hypothetical protein [Alkaliphilus transvaalensis]